MTIALIGNIYQTEKSKYLERIIRTLLSMGDTIIAEEEFLHFICQEFNFDISHIAPFSGSNFNADICLSIGGDGTFLRAAALVENKGIPILGINTGHLGFLTDVSPEHIQESLKAIHEGNFSVEERSVVTVSSEDNFVCIHPHALNEVAVLKHDNSSLIHINAEIDGIQLNNFAADGLIVSTPTGSTGYALSVGGPILAPTSGTLCLSPVASHSLNTRPVVVTDNVEIRLTVESRTNSFLLSIDGRSQSLPCSTSITIKKASFKIGVIRIDKKNFYDTLKEKLAWGRRGD